MVDRVERFGNANRLPTKIREQIMASVQLRFETSVQLQEEVLSQLPKAVRSDIEQHLFKAAVQSCYLFRGVSNSLIVELVSEMKAEYFPPRMDIVLENEIPTDCYIIVSGQVVNSLHTFRVHALFSVCFLPVFASFSVRA